MRIITMEEHYGHAGISKAGEDNLNKLVPDFAAAFGNRRTFELLFDLDNERIKTMDEDHISVQVLSNTSAQMVGPDKAVEVCEEANNYLAEAIKRHPDRFVGLAAIPTAVPEACAAELKRCVTQLGFAGAQISGRTDGKFLDDSCYAPFLAMAEELVVPIYLHPGFPPAQVKEQCYAGNLSPAVSTRMATSGYGWHVDAGTQMLHMVLSGTFDRFPKLQMILGHWGETLTYFFDRFDSTFSAEMTGLKKKPSDYLKENMYITPSGMFTQALLDMCVETIGIDRILFSVDYPYVSTKEAESFILNSSLSEEEKEKFAHLNAEKLLNIK
ncbi:hypothetical protein EDD76_111170 [Kineothrix alysoides]|uniref:Amidohydrolase-related domain-containing protein n=1 Tax=Kineothrix alysoides TaxID=1469948 RepID=A0A4R1QS18_9FIRM|nr:amidohydrolase family protein [Kineothrix alysoides]TCL56676.1 hypothetical protein EDD76_111170 [Kineothrix alysoides]